MSHMVIYRGSDGKPGYHQVDDIHDAVSFVEEMRNKDGVDHARIFRLEEVTFEFKPYYRVEIGNGAASAVASSDDDAQSSVGEIEGADDSDEESDEASNGQSEDESAELSDDDESSDDAEEDAGAGARRGLFGR